MNGHLLKYVDFPGRSLPGASMLFVASCRNDRTNIRMDVNATCPLKLSPFRRVTTLFFHCGHSGLVVSVAFLLSFFSLSRSLSLSRYAGSGLPQGPF